MPKKTQSLADDFASRAAQLEETRAKMERLLVSGSIGIADIEQVYTGLYLDIFTEFEALIEKLFMGLLSGKLYSTSLTVKKKVKMQPVSMVREVVFYGKRYLDWLPYKEYTVKRASIFFDNGEPFTLLEPIQQTQIDNYHIIRNAIAHKSDSASDKFEKMIKDLPLLPREKTPSGYLRTIPSAGTSQTQYEIAVLELEGIAKKLCV